MRSQYEPRVDSGGRRHRRRTIVITVVVAVLAVAAGAGTGGYFLLRTQGSAAQTAASYLAAWQRGDYAGMDAVSVDVPPGGVAGPVKAAESQLGVRQLRLAPGALTGNHTWTWHGHLALVTRDRHWRVHWSPAAIYPGLRTGERFVLSATWPARAQILAADGTVLSSPRASAESGSLALLTGEVVQATARQAAALGPPYVAGDLIG